MRKIVKYSHQNHRTDLGFPFQLVTSRNLRRPTSPMLLRCRSPMILFREKAPARQAARRFHHILHIQYRQQPLSMRPLYLKSMSMTYKDHRTISMLSMRQISTRNSGITPHFQSHYLETMYQMPSQSRSTLSQTTPIFLPIILYHTINTSHP